MMKVDTDMLLLLCKLPNLVCEYIVFFYIVSQAKALLTDDYGKDLVSVEALIRKHEELERDISAIDTKLEVFWCSFSRYISMYTSLPDKLGVTFTCTP